MLNCSRYTQKIANTKHDYFGFYNKYKAKIFGTEFYKLLTYVLKHCFVRLSGEMCEDSYANTVELI